MCKNRAYWTRGVSSPSRLLQDQPSVSTGGIVVAEARLLRFTLTNASGIHTRRKYGPKSLSSAEHWPPLPTSTMRGYRSGKHHVTITTRLCLTILKRKPKQTIALTTCPSRRRLPWRKACHPSLSSPPARSARCWPASGCRCSRTGGTPAGPARWWAAPTCWAAAAPPGCSSRPSRRRLHRAVFKIAIGCGHSGCHYQGLRNLGR